MRTISVTSRRGTTTVRTELTNRQAAQILAGTSGFGGDLARDYARYGDQLSANKLNWLLVLAQEALDKTKAPKPQAQKVGDLAAVGRLFNQAIENGLTNPRIRLETADGRPVVLSIAKSGQNAGSIRVTNGAPYGDPNGRFYGWLAPTGELNSRNPDQGVLAILREFASDPANVAARYGKSTGECCFCGIALTNGAAGSVSVGYGPICARRYELPWEPNGKGYEMGNGQLVEPAPSEPELVELTLDEFLRRAELCTA